MMQERKAAKKRKAAEAGGKPAQEGPDDWDKNSNAWRPFDRERDLGHAPVSWVAAQGCPELPMAMHPTETLDHERGLTTMSGQILAAGRCTWPPCASAWNITPGATFLAITEAVRRGQLAVRRFWF